MRPGLPRAPYDAPTAALRSLLRRMARRKSSSASPALTPRTPAVLARGRAGVKRSAPPRLAAGVGTPSLRRLARRAGVKRIAQPTYQSVREALNAWLRKIVADTACLVENRRRFTVTLPDVLYALKRNGRTLYGWSGEGGAWQLAGRGRTLLAACAFRAGA